MRELSSSYGLAVDPDALVRDLPVGVQQRVEILKALYREARMLILDEPTAVLTPQEAHDLFRVMRALTSERHGDHLHHPQAARGARRRRPHHVCGRARSSARSLPREARASRWRP